MSRICGKPARAPIERNHDVHRPKYRLQFRTNMLLHKIPTSLRRFPLRYQGNGVLSMDLH